jgi:catechol 2,3-dioxygenase-like lactoylglutathione lyase family enzyme
LTIARQVLLLFHKTSATLPLVGLMDGFPKVDRILESALYVDDLERSARFYRRLLGFEVIDAGERLIALGVPGRQVLLLFKKGASADLPRTPHDGHGQLHLAFAIATDELDRWRAWLQRQEIAIEDDRAWDRGGRSLYFRDPDGHLLEVATPGVWSIY